MELPSPVSRYVPQKSKKRVFPGGSSSCEAEVVEIPSMPPSNPRSKSRSLKKKEVIHGEIIDVDGDDDCGDGMPNAKKVAPNGKGKELMDNILSNPADGTKKGSVDDALLPKNFTAANVINLDDFGNNAFYGDDKYLNTYLDDVSFDNEYAMFLQSQFDSMDMPTGVEAPIPWMPGHSAKKMKSSPATTKKKSLSKPKLNNVGSSSGLDSSHAVWPSQSAQTMLNPGSSTIGQAQSSTWSFPKPAQGKSYLTTASSYSHANQPLIYPPNSYLGNTSSFVQPHSSSHQGKQPFTGGATAYNSSSHTPTSNKQPFTGGATAYNSSSHKTTSNKQPFTGGASYATSNTQKVNIWSNAATSMPNWQGTLNVPGGNPWVSQKVSNGPSHAAHISIKGTPNSLLDDPALAPSGSATSAKVDEIMEKFQLFKNFDTVEDFSDHYFHQQNSSVKQPSKAWSKKIQEEWRILEKDLPDTIFVRVYESRMDILRAVIIGAEGTPYHDGLFFFDVFFPSNYPSVPPKVHYHSGGLRINPNLYNCGKVCLSLLNTWSGSQKEKWIPRSSTMLQVLVSIQGLILNTKPYFNEPGYARMSGSVNGEKSSLQYNERTFILSLKTMVYSIRRPPKHFEDFVAGHFCKRAKDILAACQAYIEGVQVGCIVKGGVQDVDEGNQSCSPTFKRDVASFINMLVDAFKQVGAKDCEKFLPLAQKANGVKPAGPTPAYNYY